MPLFPTILLLAACIDGSAWPTRGAAPTSFFDTGTATGSTVTTPTLPCNRADEGTNAQLTVQNPNPVAYRLSQMDDSCTEQFFVEIAPNDAWNGTVGNHIFFVVREADDTYVRYFGIPSGTQVSWVETLP